MPGEAEREKEIMALLIKADSSQTRVFPLKTVFEYQELEDLIWGLPEEVILADGRVMIVDEQGKIKGLPVNFVASKLNGYVNVGEDIANRRADVSRLIVGDVLVADRSELDLPEEKEEARFRVIHLDPPYRRRGGIK